MRALSIRQPFAELILRGMKTIEYRSRATHIIGERFWIYAARGDAAKATGRTNRGIWSRDLAVPGEPLPPWMLELAEGLRLWKPGELPTGVIVGSAVIERCEPPSGDVASRSALFQWHIGGVERLGQPRKPVRHPQPVWFVPF